MKKIVNSIFFLLIIINIYAQKGKIEGRVYNATNNESLPFSNILIAGSQTGAMADFEGKFIITGVDAGFVKLQVSSLGYETLITEDIQVTSNKTFYIDIPLKETGLKLQEVSVVGSRFSKIESSPVSVRTISVSEIENNPGANRDISKVIQSFPGVALTAVNRNDVIVRGGGSNESRFFLDDVEIPNINHFSTQGASGGSNGILNADFIRQVDFFSGAFPANRGNALSAVFNFRQIDGNPEKIKFRGTVGASELSMTIDGPLGEKTNYIFSARRSYLQYLFKVIGLPFLPVFNDYQLKIRSRLNDKNEIKIISIGALDQFSLDTKIKNPDENQRYILSFLPVYKQWTYTFGTVYKHFRKNGYYTLVYSRNMFNYRIYKYLNNDETVSSNKIIDYISEESENKVRVENTIEMPDNFRIDMGAGFEHALYSNNTFQKIFFNNATDSILYNSLLDFYKYNAFGQASKGFFSGKLTLSLGLRTDASTYSKDMVNPLQQVSPRFSASYQLTEKIILNFNAGRYYQLPAYTTLGYRDASGTLVNKNNNLKYIFADHLIAGIEYFPMKNSKISFEGFYKNYDRYPFSLKDSISLANRPADFGVVGDEAVVSSSQGRAYGFEALGQFSMEKDWNIVVSYTYVRSEFKDKNRHYAPSSWDSRHIFISTLSKKFKRNWLIGMKWRFAGGLPYTPYDLQKSELISAWDLSGRAYLDFNRVNNERFRPFHQLDVRIDKIIYFKKTSLKFYLDIQNLYNFKSEEQDRVTNLDQNGQPVINPNDNTRYVLRTIDNNGAGTVLPTIGIIFDF